MGVLAIEKAIHYLLTSGSDSAALNTIRSSRCRPGFAAPDDERPYQIFDMPDGGDEGNMGGANSGEASLIRVESVADTRSELISLMAATRDALHGKGETTVTIGADSLTIYEMEITSAKTKRNDTTSGEVGADYHRGEQLIEVFHQVST